MISDLLLLTGAFLASAVEMVEALTLVFAMGVTRGWRSPLIGSAVALVILAVTVAVLGPLLTEIPLAPLRIIIGGLLVIFGLQWLRKAILRASGYRRCTTRMPSLRRRSRLPGRLNQTPTVGWTGMRLPLLSKACAWKASRSPLSSSPLVPHTAASPGCHRRDCGIAHRLDRRGRGACPTERVPENTMKFAVGVMLTGFGIYWAGEGVNIEWPGGTVALGVILVATLGWPGNGGAAQTAKGDRRTAIA